VGLALYGWRHAPRASNGTADTGVKDALKRMGSWLGGMF
jgi:hypothetical protein